MGQKYLGVETIEALLLENLVDFGLVENELCYYQKIHPNSPLVLLANANKHGFFGEFWEAYNLIRRTDYLSCPQYFIAAVTALDNALRFGVSSDYQKYNDLLLEGALMFSNDFV